MGVSTINIENRVEKRICNGEQSNRKERNQNINQKIYWDKAWLILNHIQSGSGRKDSFICLRMSIRFGF